ncbi:hypothetical protein OWR29_26020 [Actinoplanes sp. Pm04-4]|uniref:Uncharacterized protein n=1 Tax=Paractinoplanes pyxinae TaxID=2997416 RepID=A0ABT4B4P9_9ACTN|nr:hypothetical protein [Actinoplanes pyxinae]MCY1141468.1 hypothetical protein [Actinoplanes pyxinae]
MPGESVGQQSAAGRVSPVRGLAVDQGIRRRDPAVDLVRPSQGHRARKARFYQQKLGFVGDLGRVKVNRWSMRFEDKGASVLQLDSPDDVDAPGAEANLRDRAAQTAFRLGIEKRAQLKRRHGPVDGRARYH